MAEMNSAKRQRIVSFRVTEQEYASLQKASESCGASSISEYARTVACNGGVLQVQATSVDLGGQVQVLRSRVDQLFGLVTLLAQRFQTENSHNGSCPA